MKAPAKPDRWRPLWRVTNRFESLELRWLGTSGITLLGRTDVLVLETTGRRTGKRRRTPVAYWTNGGTYFLGGGAAGMSKVDWVANLRANPEAGIWIRRRRLPVVACELEGDEYERVRAEAFRRWPDAPSYELRSGRRIPYFSLRAVAPSADKTTS